MVVRQSGAVSTTLIIGVDGDGVCKVGALDRCLTRVGGAGAGPLSVLLQLVQAVNLCACHSAHSFHQNSSQVDRLRIRSHYV